MTADPATERVGHLVIGWLREAEELWRLFTRAIYFCFRSRYPGRGVARQMYLMGNQSLLFLVVVMAFIGMIAVYQGGIQLKRVLPEMSQLGSTYLELLIKDLSPTICGLMLATRVGAGIAAEIGAMVVTEQVDALRMCAADPVDYLIRPRFIAGLWMTLFLIIIATAVGGLAGALTGGVFFSIDAETFLDFRQVDVGDVIEGTAKAIVYGATIPIVSGYCGLTTHGGSQGVGTATTRAVVLCSLCIIIQDFVIASISYALFA